MYTFIELMYMHVHTHTHMQTHTPSSVSMLLMFGLTYMWASVCVGAATLPRALIRGQLSLVVYVLTL